MPQPNATPHPEPGAYEVRGVGPKDRITTGVCAGCLGDVGPQDAFVIRYAVGKRGGIFHRACAPTGPEWYPIDDEHGC